MSELGDCLLFALSAWKEISWQKFKRAFEEFAAHRFAERVTDLRHDRFRSALVLDSLGHCDVAFSAGRGVICAAPPLLVLLPTPGLPRAILTGSRSPEMVHRMRGLGRLPGAAFQTFVASQAHRHPFAPARILVEANTREDLVSFSQESEVPLAQIPPAWHIAIASGSLSEYLESLHWSEDPEPTWSRSDFDPWQVRFVSPSELACSLRLSRYLDPVRGVHIYRLWRQTRSAVVEPDWGRYAVLSDAGVRVLSFDSGVVTVPTTTPLPRLLSRSLTMCSGYAATVSQRRSESHDSPFRAVQVYEGIPSALFGLVSARLRQPDTLVGNGDL